MASEILSVPEENLEEFIRILRIGISESETSKYPATEFTKYLESWCSDEEEYLDRIKSD